MLSSRGEGRSITQIPAQLIQYTYLLRNVSVSQKLRTTMCRLCIGFLWTTHDWITLQTQWQVLHVNYWEVTYKNTIHFSETWGKCTEHNLYGYTTVSACKFSQFFTHPIIRPCIQWLLSDLSSPETFTWKTVFWWHWTAFLCGPVDMTQKSAELKLIKSLREEWKNVLIYSEIAIKNKPMFITVCAFFAY